ncbi:hypothetical protein K438DRAFT_1755869 [Mycena galopus ATCC 62051]|nr:hypothetical protein K438DRAFT_1755869 [Mycena galopus ATCC 62051]
MTFVLHYTAFGRPWAEESKTLASRIGPKSRLGPSRTVSWMLVRIRKTPPRRRRRVSLPRVVLFTKAPAELCLLHDAVLQNPGTSWASRSDPLNISFVPKNSSVSLCASTIGGRDAISTGSAVQPAHLIQQHETKTGWLDLSFVWGSSHRFGKSRKSQPSHAVQDVEQMRIV